MTEDEGGKPDDAIADDDASLGEPVDLDSLAPPPDTSEPQAAPPAPSSDDVARAQAAARKLAGASGRRGALGRTPSTIEDAAKPALTQAPTTGIKPAASSVATPSKTAVSDTPKPSLPPTGRRPLVDPKQRVKKSVPFYEKLRLPKKGVIATLLVVVVAGGGWFGWRALDHARHADEYAVRDELFLYKFDHDDKHFAAIDDMGTKGVQLVVDSLTDMQTVETSFGKSSTTKAELANMYLMHYAQRVGVDPPAKALDVVKLGAVRQTPADWAQLKESWGKWFADVQAKGKAR